MSARVIGLAVASACALGFTVLAQAAPAAPAKDPSAQGTIVIVKNPSAQGTIVIVKAPSAQGTVVVVK